MLNLTPDQIRPLEEIQLSTWPTLRTALVDGYVARLGNGVTGRANSVNAVYASTRPAPEVLAELEELYKAAGLPTVFRDTPLLPDAMREALTVRGYKTFKPSVVQLAQSLPEAEADPAVAFKPKQDNAWLDALGACGVVRGLLEKHRALLSLIAHPARFATLSEDGEVLAVALGVLDRGHFCIYEVNTAPAARGRGIGKRLMRALLAEGRRMGGTKGLLQTQGDNEPARALYRGFGFEVIYPYGYWQR
ncbi:GNAT family N-acetyltransferase [Lacibacterium aquatile]|uniref:GNAT family N-acetyltransferase n=1 Tax=Lacibacterium aquatile TaxID=1168082 RepID=A0ABW5E1J6_9PROT